MPSIRQMVLSLYAAGTPPAEIARQLGVATTTVSYHVEEPRQPQIQFADDSAPPAVMRPRTRIAVLELLEAGVSRTEIARRLSISKATVSYHARRLGARMDEPAARRYDWSAIQRYYDGGHTVRDCMRTFGFSSSSWCDAVRRGALVPRPSATPLAELLVPNTYRGRHNLKLRLIRAGLKDGRCEQCARDTWRGKPLNLALHHINGDRLDNRLENLALLCPNCHSQTDTYSGRNGHRRTATA